MANSKTLSSSVRIVIADHQSIVRTALRTLLETCPTIHVVGEARDGPEAVERALALAPDVMLLELAMPRLNGIEVARRVTAACPQTRVLALTVLEGPEYVHAASKAGALGYIPKTAAAADLIAAIHSVADGKRVVHPLALTGTEIPTVPAVTDPVGLSSREADVIRMLALGFTAKEIALQLGLSAKTVETYKVRAEQKIGARSRADLVRFALACGLLSRAAKTVVGTSP
jgi:DNA-binding NarL/FixJ family response regulator